MEEKTFVKKQIVFVSSEAVPFSKTGGLADVAGELAQSLAKQGHDVLVISPWYHDLKLPEGTELHESARVNVPFDGGTRDVHIAETMHNGVKYGFVGNQYFYGKTIKDCYHADNKNDIFALFSSAVPEVATALGFAKPDIIHAHDWHTGFLPAIVRDRKDLPQGFNENAKTVFTIHNAAFQGIADIDQTLNKLGLPVNWRNSSLNNHGVANALTAAAGSADVVTTVSPSYAAELRAGTRTPELSLGAHYPIKGIINGVSNEWKIPSLELKKQKKQELCDRFGLSGRERPLIGLVSRITKDQKGIDIFINAVDRLIEQGWNVVVAGEGDGELMHQLTQKAAHSNGHMAYHAGFSHNELTHTIITGSDAFAIPSRFEPCGITQMQAMGSGTLPIASKTGGLRDTIANGKDGFLFNLPPNDDAAVATDNLVATAQRAIDLYRSDPSAWRGMMQAATDKDFSWDKIATSYDALYDGVLSPKLNPDRKPWQARLSKHREQPKAQTHQNQTALRAYNMLPRNYGSYAEMTQDVKRVAEMGFGTVWINPLCEVGNLAQPDWSKFDAKTKLLPPLLEDTSRTRSLYAMSEPFSFNPEFATDKNDPQNVDKAKAEIKKLTSAIRANGMMAMYDVAFSHMAKDSEWVKGKVLHDKEGAVIRDKNGKVIDTSHWFEHHKNGTLVMHGVDSEGKVTNYVDDKETIPNPKMVWSDIAVFNYDDPKIRDEIIEYLWKPYIDQMVELGFTGIRVDSIAQNRRDILDPISVYLKQKVHEKFPTIHPYDVDIFGETLGRQTKHYVKSDHITHAYSSAYWAPIVSIDGMKECAAFWREQHETGANWLTEQNGKLDLNVCGSMIRDEDGTLFSKPQFRGGPAGFAGSVDEPNIVDYYLHEGYTLSRAEFEASPDKNLKLIHLDTASKTGAQIGEVEVDVESKDGTREKVDVKQCVDMEKAEQAVREKMAQTMLLCAGGHFLFAGDEHMQLGPRSVFKGHRKGVPLKDLSAFVADINRITLELSPPISGNWATRRSVTQKDMVIMERHTKPGFDGITDVIIINTTPESKEAVMKLSHDQLAAIAKDIRVEKRNEHGQLEPNGGHITAQDLAEALKGQMPSSGVKLRVHCDRRIELSPMLDRACHKAERAELVAAK